MKLRNCIEGELYRLFIFDIEYIVKFINHSKVNRKHVGKFLVILGKDNVTNIMLKRGTAFYKIRKL